MLRPIPSDIAMLVFGATCQQGSNVTPKSYTARIVMMIVFTVLMFLFASYSANIVALLQAPSNQIRTLDDLLNSRLSFGVDDTVFNRYYFSHATEPTRKAIFEQKIINKDGSLNFMSLTDGVEKIRHVIIINLFLTIDVKFNLLKGLFAFHMELGVGYKVMSETFLEDEKCGMTEIQYLQVPDPWYAIKKNSSYKEYFKVG